MPPPFGSTPVEKIFPALGTSARHSPNAHAPRRIPDFGSTEVRQQVLRGFQSSFMAYLAPLLPYSPEVISGEVVVHQAKFQIEKAA
jgi:hypothetical protein